MKEIPLKNNNTAVTFRNGKKNNNQKELNIQYLSKGLTFLHDKKKPQNISLLWNRVERLTNRSSCQQLKGAVIR